MPSSPWTLIATDPAANTHTHRPDGSRPDDVASWTYGDAQSPPTWRTHTRRAFSPERSGGKAAYRREYVCTRQCECCSFCILRFGRKRKKRKRKKGNEIRGEESEWGERGQKGRIWTMVSNQRTLVHWWAAALLTNRACEGGGEAGLRVGSARPEQLVPASATETNDWATAHIYIYIYIIYTLYYDQYIYIYMTNTYYRYNIIYIYVYI